MGNSSACRATGCSYETETLGKHDANALVAPQSRRNPYRSAVGREPIGARYWEIAMVVRAGDLVNRRAFRAVVPAHLHLAEPSTDGAVALGPTPLSLYPDRATVGEHERDVSGQPDHRLAVASVRNRLAVAIAPREIVSEIDHGDGLAAVGRSETTVRVDPRAVRQLPMPDREHAFGK